MHTRWLIPALICLTSQAFCYPAIGDKVTWSGTMKNALGESSDVQITKEVIDFNYKSKLWKVKVHTQIGENSSDEILDIAELFTPERYQEVLKNCELRGGVIEEVSTNPGKYKTCKTRTITDDGVTIEKWIGDLPFGVVSKTTQDQTGIAQSPVRGVLRDL